MSQITTKVESDRKERHVRAKTYSKKLSHIKDISYKKYLYNSNDCYLSFPILCKKRDDLYLYLIQNNIDVSKYFYRDCNQIDIFKKFKENCPNAKYVTDHVLMLPLYPGYSFKRIELICKKISEYYA